MSAPRPRAILFDMGDTLIHESAPDFPGGVRHLLQLAHNPRQASPMQVLQFAREVSQDLLAARETSLMEFSCLGLQRLLYERFGLKFDQSPEEIELEFRRAAFHSATAPGIAEVLARLEQCGIRRAVLSNSIFTRRTLELDLEQHGLLPHFEFVMSSAEYCLRKPHPALFLTACGKFNLEPAAVWYAGDNWECDVCGAAGAGMPSIWYNPASRPCPNGDRPMMEVHSWAEFLELSAEIW